MRFVFFSAQYLPTVGGVERYTACLAAAIVKMGHSAAVVTSALPGLPEHEINVDGIEVFRLPSRLFMRGRFPLPKFGAAFKALAAALFAGGCDMAVIQTRFYPLSLWAARQCHRRGIPAIVVEHGSAHLSAQRACLNFFFRLYEHAVIHAVQRYCGRFYGVSGACCDWLLHFGVRAKGTLYNAVDPDALQKTAGAVLRDFRAEFAEGGPMAVFAGRLIREKGVCELTGAFTLVREKHPHAVLVLAGDGPMKAELAALKRPGVFFTGALPYGEAIALLRSGDVFCLPTYSEGFATTVLEAAALGACVITTKTGGSPELIKDGVNGILLNDISPAAIANAVCFAFDNPAWRIQAGTRAEKEVRAGFRWALVAARLEKIALGRGENI